MQFSHVLDVLWSLVLRHPVLFGSILLTFGGLGAYVYLFRREEWDAYCASVMPPVDKERQDVEALLAEDPSELSDRIHRWSGPATVKALLLRKLRQIEKTSPFGGTSSSGDQAERTWIERVLQVPLGVTTPPPETPVPELLRKAKESLDRSLLGQNEVKLRILEILSGWLRSPESPPPVLGLLGPPGVGKTSIARCISEVLGRPVQSISFGGRKDSAEIKGHSPTYVGAQWGALVQALVDAKTTDPVIYCDEIDKIGGLAFGAGGSEVYHVLLHATDPAQNEHFQDAYLPGIPIDLSRVVFVVSVNETAQLPKPLLDRIQWVQMNGYDESSKYDILEQSLWSTVLRELGLEGRFALDPAGAAHLVSTIAQEPGVRKLRQALDMVLRRAALLQDLREQPAFLEELGWSEGVPVGVWTLDEAAMKRLLAWSTAEDEPDA
jgi:ATP-dependent Lon protease